MNTDLDRAIVGDGVYLKAQRVRRPVPFNVVQMEHLPTSSGQLFNGATQRNTANRSTEVKILFPNLAFERWRVPRYRLIERKHWWGFTTQLHQYGVHGNPVQPSGKGEPPRNELRFPESSRWFSALSGITSTGGGTFLGVADVAQVATLNRPFI